VYFDVTSFQLKEEFYMPLWIKALLGFGLVMAGILFTFITYRFFPVKKESGFDNSGSLTFVFISLGMVIMVYIIGLLIDKRHPYSLFILCLLMFVLLLAAIRIVYL
jgi:hypothetical protein